MTRLILLLVLGGMVTGCATLERTAKLATDAALDAVQTRIPILSGKIKEEVGNQIKQGIEALSVAAAQKSEDVLYKAQLMMLKKAGVAWDLHDSNADGIMSDAELTMAWKEAEGKKEDWVWWLKILSAFGATGASFTGLKSVRRYLASKTGGEPVTT